MAGSGLRVIEWDDETTYKLPGRRVVAVFNQKGGVGKTTTTINLSVELALHGARVLVLDMDPQANTTTGFGVNPNQAETTMYEVLHPVASKRVSLTMAAMEVRPGLWLVPGHEALGSIEESGNGPGGELLLRYELAGFGVDVDFVVIDCPPNLGRLSIAALSAVDPGPRGAKADDADGVDLLVPVKVGPDEMDGLARLLTTLDRVRENGLAAPRVTFAVTTMYDGRENLARDVDGYVARTFGSAHVPKPIRRAVRVGEAKSYRMPLSEFDPGSPVTADYRDLAKAVVARVAAA